MRKMSDLVRERAPVLLQLDTSVKEACRRMRERRAGAALILSADGSLAGVFTRGDAINRVLAEGRGAVDTTVGQVMTPNPRAVSPTVTVIEALRIMSDHGFRHLPVVRDDKVVGLVFRGDFRGRELDRIEEEAEIWERI